jgi:hypothetical protein
MAGLKTIIALSFVRLPSPQQSSDQFDLVFSNEPL